MKAKYAVRSHLYNQKIIIWLTSRFDLSLFFFSSEKNLYLSIHLLWIWLRDQNDVPKFHNLLLQFLGNLDHFEVFVSTRNIGKSLFGLALLQDDEGLIWRKYDKILNCFWNINWCHSLLTCHLQISLWDCPHIVNILIIHKTF